MHNRLKAGVIGFDTSHVVCFTRLTREESEHRVEGIDIVAGYPSFSPDVEISASRVEGYRQEMVEKWGVRITSSIEELLDLCDVILLESVDGRRHLKEVEPVLRAGKPVFIDKPLASSYKDASTIAAIAREYNCPFFSSSSLRFDQNIQQALNKVEIGRIRGCDATGPAAIQEANPGLFWYGIHAVEILYTFMGRGCQTVYCESTSGTSFVTGKWSDGRIGTVRGIRDGASKFGATLYGEKGITSVASSETVPFYSLLLKQIVNFFKTGISPVDGKETLEIMRFMDAAMLSEKKGRAVKIDEVE